MKKTILPFFFFSILLTSCSTTVKFGLSQKYYLDESEREGIIEQIDVDKYESVINIDTLNIPLNKLIYSKKYKVYIGVSFYNKPATLYSIYSSDDNYNIIDTKIMGNEISFLYKRGNAFFYSYLFDSQKDKLSYVLTLESDSLITKAKFEETFLLSKLKK